MDEVQKIVDARDFHNSVLGELVRRDPDFVANEITQKTVPRWFMDLFMVLTRLYDQGHSDAIADLDKLR
jgi:hypothetical protein